MQERAVTIDGTPLPLPESFFCIATQNPIEMEGTYPLPESQIDRFLMRVEVGYPDEVEEQTLLERYRDGREPTDLTGLSAVTTPGQLAELRRAATGLVVDDSVLGYINSIVRATRSATGVVVGGSPRSNVALLQCSRSWALINGREYVTPDDVKDMAIPVLCHRLILTPEAEIEGVRPYQIIGRILESTEVPR